MIASELVFNNLDSNNKNLDIPNFYNEFLRSWAGQELKKARNVRPSSNSTKNRYDNSGIDQLILRGKHHGQSRWRRGSLISKK